MLTLPTSRKKDTSVSSYDFESLPAYFHNMGDSKDTPKISKEELVQRSRNSSLGLCLICKPSLTSATSQSLLFTTGMSFSVSIRSVESGSSAGCIMCSFFYYVLFYTVLGPRPNILRDRTCPVRLRAYRSDAGELRLDIELEDDMGQTFQVLSLNGLCTSHS